MEDGTSFMRLPRSILHQGFNLEVYFLVLVVALYAPTYEVYQLLNAFLYGLGINLSTVSNRFNICFWSVEWTTNEDYSLLCYLDTLNNICLGTYRVFACASPKPQKRINVGAQQAIIPKNVPNQNFVPILNRSSSWPALQFFWCNYVIPFCSPSLWVFDLL